MESDLDIEFNPSKYQVVQVAGCKKPIGANYLRHCVLLGTVTCAKSSYLEHARDMLGIPWARVVKSYV